MRYQALSIIVLCSTFLVGCNDAPSNRGVRTASPSTSDTNMGVYSGIHRERGSNPLSYRGEIAVNSESNSIRPIPDIRFDDDGSDGKNTVVRSIRPTIPCGLVAGASLNEKIADCALETKNGVLASWNGTLNAGSAEGSWSLVSLSRDSLGGYEVWLDRKTSMLWSGVVSTGANWCAASGSSLGISEEVGVDCMSLGDAQSLCTNYNLAELKNVNWRLPSRHDYLQADLDGIRFVLSRGNAQFWTATTSTDVQSRNKAWSYNMIFGSLLPEPMATQRSVRCIGTTSL